MIDYGNRDVFQRQTFDDQVSNEIERILHPSGRCRDAEFRWAISDMVEYLARLKRTTFADPKVIARAAVDRVLERERHYQHDTGAVKR